MSKAHPIDPHELVERFTYHPPTPGQPAVYEEIRARALEFAQYLHQVCPESFELDFAIEALDTCVMKANAAIARHPKPA
jgi:glycine cleavage system protein P-like pyridoxal-binding family